MIINETIILYPDTDKELFMSDYRPIPCMDNVPLYALLSMLNNLVQAFENAYTYHSPLLENALFDDIITVTKAYIRLYICSMSSGNVACIIGRDQYKDIDNATKKALLLLNSETGTELIINQELSTDPDSIAGFIRKAFTGV